MAVIPARARRLGDVRIDQRFAGIDDRRPFLGRSVLRRRDHQAVPMNQIGVAGTVLHLDLHRTTLLEAQHGTGHGAVVGGRLDDLARRDFERGRSDPDRMVGSSGHLSLTPDRTRRPHRKQRSGAERRAAEQAPSAHAWARREIGFVSLRHRKLLWLAFAVVVRAQVQVYCPIIPASSCSRMWQ